MTVNPEVVSILTGVLGLVLVALNSAPAAINIFDRVSTATRPIRLEGAPDAVLGYQDEDGEATDDSLNRFTDTWQRVAVVIFSVIGLELTLALAIVGTEISPSHFVPSFWLQLGNWTLLCLQAVALFTEASSLGRYKLSIYSFWASVVTVVVPCIQITLLWSSGQEINPGRAPTGLLVAQTVTACLRGLCSILIPRRPNVYHNGQVVDQEFTCSLYSRLTFSWVHDLMRYAVENQNLEIESLPKLPYVARAETLYTRLESTRHGRKLWKALVLGNMRPFITQAVLSLITCILSFGPQIAMYGILKCLEGSSLSTRNNPEAWLWVAGLGSMIVVSYGIESWLWWIISSQLWVPIYEGLSTLIFAKAMRCKDVKQTRLTSCEGTSGDEEEQQEKSRQSIINLAAVDSRRVADFATFNYLIPSCLLRLLLAGGFLAHLLGWRSLLAGLTVSAVVTPLNTFVTKRYSAAQEEFMKANDKRASTVTEVLQGIRQIKFAALEQQWQERIMDRRQVELGHLWKTSLYTTVLVAVWVLGPLMLSAVSLTVYALTYGNLPASVAFTALSVFGNLESALAGLPDLISKGMEAFVSSNRIDEYLASVEKPTHTSDVDQIFLDSATISWPAQEEESLKLSEMDDRFVLRNLTLQFPPKGLSIIAGKTGSGKSLLLASIIGECDVIEGSVAVPRSPPLEERFDDRATRDNWIIDNALAYVAQNPWMENASIRSNILFGLPYNWRRYKKVLVGSGLEEDLNILPDGDMTDIGANGINLSGGQRWRVSLARALYSRAGILVMDDIFSALDAETGRHVYEHGLTGDLAKGRTRILVTHHVGLCLPRTDYCVLLENGYMTHAGTVEQLRGSHGLTDLLQGLNAELRDLRDREVARDASRRKRSSLGPPPPNDSHIPKQFTPEEKRATGSIPIKVYMAYMTKGNSWLSWSITFLAYVACMTLIVGRSWWVSLWTGSNTPSDSQQFNISWRDQFNTVQVDPDLLHYLRIYVALSAAACVVGALRQLVLSFASLQSSRQLFDDLLTTVLRAPMRWLDTVPLGRVLNRFTSDIYTVDWRLAFDLGHFVSKLLELVGIMVAGTLVSPSLLALSCSLLLFCLYLSNWYLVGARELKRLESNSKSPVMEQFSSSLAGLTTIRAFDKTDTYIRQMYSKIDRHAQTVWHSWLFNRWLAFRMSVVGAVFATGAAALIVYVPTIPAALAGFAITFALQYNYAVSMGLRFYAEMEMDMNSTERILEYSTIQMEDQGGYVPPAAWPLRGRVEVEDLVVGYAPDLPPVLDGLSFNMQPNQRVGVVGRTGAGKSSLTLALFRFLDARAGRIIIDGLDISTMTLQSLRSRLAIIPQDPVLFSGTVRSNLDPFDEYTDMELNNALERVHLLSFEDTLTLAPQSHHESLSGSDTLASTPISPTAGPAKSSNAFTSLSSPISEGGLNLSQGQRQLLCLARAIVAQPKIMILDEATSAVDMETDALIQKSIRAEFGRNDSSLLVIAHRLSTIADFDRILVMDAGKAVEFGPPSELLQIQGGAFRNLVENSGERAVLEDMIMGKRN